MSVPLTTPPEQQFETMDQVEQLARAGVHLISDPPQRFYSSSDELADYVEDFIDRMTDAGCRAIPFVNAQAPLSTLRKLVPRLARIAADRQWPIGLRLDPFLLGLAAVETLTRPGLVLFAYSQLGRVLSSGPSGVSPRVLAYLLRVLGVDIVAMGTGSVTFERPESIPAVVDELRRIAIGPGIKPSCPLLTGGIGPRAAHSLAQQYGSQIALHAARSVFEGPLQLRDNVAAIRQAFMLGLAGKGYEEAVEHGGRQHKQLVDFERKIAATN